jgi:hypothetical protein
MLLAYFGLKKYILKQKVLVSSLFYRSTFFLRTLQYEETKLKNKIGHVNMSK